MSDFINIVDAILCKRTIGKIEGVARKMPEGIVTEYKCKPEREAFHKECG
jgi:hypothetical protein